MTVLLETMGVVLSRRVDQPHMCVAARDCEKSEEEGSRTYPLD